MDDAFEWDEQKAAGNLLKHGVSFRRAVSAFHDPFAAAIADRRYDYGEDRFLLVAQADGRIGFSWLPKPMASCWP